MLKGKFIVFEGINGCGKTSQLKKIIEEVISNENKYKKYQFVFGKEPTYDSEYGLKLRELMLKSKNPHDDAELFTEYMIKDREHHCKNFIIPNLNYGANVILDRYKHSTYAFQQAQGIHFDLIALAHKKISSIIAPDLTFIFDVPSYVAIQRLKKRDKKRKFEQRDFLELVRWNYLSLPKMLSGEKIIIIDGTKSIDDIFSQVKSEFEKLF